MTRKFRISVNGKAYDVDVEELAAGAAPAPVAVAPAPVAAAPAPVAAAPTPVAAPAAAPAGGAGTISAPMPGKILKILVQQGAAVTAGQQVLVLEAMKMENEIYSPVAGTVTQIACKEGDSVNTGDTMVVIG